MHHEAGLAITLTAQERLDINLSATFVELAISLSTVWANESSRILLTARGGDAPYRIRNFTGIPLNIWSDVDGRAQNRHNSVVRLLEDECVDWRFEDWKSMREASTS